MEKINLKIKKNNKLIAFGTMLIIIWIVTLAMLYFVLQPLSVNDIKSLSVPTVLILYIVVILLTMHHRTYIQILDESIKIGSIPIHFKDIVLGRIVGSRIVLQYHEGAKKREAEIYMNYLSLQDIQSLLDRFSAKSIEVKSF